MTSKNPTGDDDLIRRFLKVYDNLPLEERIKVILVLNDEPVTWKLARDYIIHNPSRGKVILKKLDELNII